MALRPQSAGGNGKQENKGDERDNVFMREVDDALRQDQMTEFLTRYGRWVLLVLVIALIGFAGWIYYNHRQSVEADQRGEEFVQALDAARGGNLDGAKNALKPLAESGQPGYRAAAQAMQAAILLEQDNPNGAVAAYAKLAADESAPQPFRDLALVRQTAAEYDTLAPAKVVERLKALAVPGNPWFGSAGEMVAIAHMRMDKPELAGPLFLQLAEEESVPDTIRSRARQMAGLMGVDAVDDPNEAQGVAQPSGVRIPQGTGRP